MAVPAMTAEQRAKESEDQRPHPGDPTPAMERAWLARVVAAQAAGRARRGET
ncbi:hypothetical protein [Nonomuraea turkmeniaca]|uniref:hypothetical protein n=1 Tax=Nonomuraea turkmeniaca TaxID=103838 RepID=UPI0014775BB0|nr:hypothetical protein [Nonomuraea turkmeniaca]